MTLPYRNRIFLALGFFFVTAVAGLGLQTAGAQECRGGSCGNNTECTTTECPSVDAPSCQGGVCPLPKPASVPADEAAKTEASEDVPAAAPALTFDKEEPAEKEQTAPAPREVKKDFTLAVVRDNDSAQTKAILLECKKKLFALLAGKVALTLREDSSYCANGKAAAATSALDEALNDPKIDGVLAMGDMVLASALKRPLTKPVVSTAAPLTCVISSMSETSLGLTPVDNLARATVPDLIPQDLKMIERLFPGREVITAIDDSVLSLAPYFAENFKQLAMQTGAKVTIQPSSKLSSLPASSAGNTVVYLAGAEGISKKQKTELFNALASRKFPVYSMFGHDDVRDGALAGLAVQTSSVFAGRAAANLQQIILGANPSEMDGDVEIDKRLLLNATTGRAIGYNAPFTVMLLAEVIGAEETKAATLNLSSAIDLALRQNIDIDIAKQTTDVTRLQRNSTIAAFLPTANVTYGMQQIDADTANLSGGTGWRESTDGFNISQTLFSPTLISNFRVAQRSYLSQQHQQEATRLDVIQTAAKNYIAFLQAQALFRIEIDNFKVTQDNLELARVRYKVGRSGPEEVYRWETQEAEGNAELLSKKTSLEQMRIALNQTLGMDQDARWDAEDVKLESYRFLQDNFGEILSDPEKLKRFIIFSVRQGFKFSPALKAHDMGLSSKRCEMQAKGWRFFLPTVTASLDFDHQLTQNREAEYEEFDDDQWVARMDFTLPVFEGGNRVIELRQAKAEYRQLERERRKTMQATELNIRTIIRSLESTYPKIQYYATASDRSDKNLKVVLDKYRQGTVTILDLLDAQNESFQWEQQAAISIYDFIADMIDYQRAISWFEMDKTETEQKNWMHGLKTSLQTEQSTVIK